VKAHHKSPLPAGANLRTALAAGPPIQAIFSIIPAIEIVEMIGLAGFTAVILDMEHGPYDIDSIGGLILAARARASMPVARVRRLDAALIGAALDAGAAGVLVPQITSPAGAAAAVRAARFAPQGMRGANPWVRAADFEAAPDWFSKSNACIAVMVMIEGSEGLQALPDILEVNGLDAVFLGPVDMAQ